MASRLSLEGPAAEEMRKIKSMKSRVRFEGEEEGEESILSIG